MKRSNFEMKCRGCGAMRMIKSMLFGKLWTDHKDWEPDWICLTCIRWARSFKPYCAKCWWVSDSDANNQPRAADCAKHNPERAR